MERKKVRMFFFLKKEGVEQVKNRVDLSCEKQIDQVVPCLIVYCLITSIIVK